MKTKPRPEQEEVVKMVHRGEGFRVTVQQIRTERSYWDLRLGLVHVKSGGMNRSVVDGLDTKYRLERL